MKTRIYSPDIECDSCVKVLGRALKRTKGVTSYDVTKEYIDIQHDKNTVSVKQLLALIKEKGYRAFLDKQERPRIRDRAREFMHDKKKYAIEWRMLRYITIIFLVLLALEAGLLSYLDSIQPGTFATYAWWIFYLTISVVFLAGAIWHYKAYRTTVTCMTGMMIGMTIGMQTGMLLGAVFGVTNGFFWGAMIGMLLGSLVGVYTGNCCGIMGVMEGMMAGIMGGTMGAMITVMMFADNILIFMPVYVLLNIIILIGFSYMLFEELVEGREIGKDVHVRPIGFWPFAIATTAVLALLTAIIFVAPVSIFLV